MSSIEIRDQVRVGIAELIEKTKVSLLQLIDQYEVTSGHAPSVAFIRFVVLDRDRLMGKADTRNLATSYQAVFKSRFYCLYALHAEEMLEVFELYYELYEMYHSSN